MESGTGGSALSGRQSQRCPQQAALLAWLGLSSPPGNKLQNGILLPHPVAGGWVRLPTAPRSRCLCMGCISRGYTLRLTPVPTPQLLVAPDGWATSPHGWALINPWLGHLAPPCPCPMVGPRAPWGWVPIALLMGHPCPMAACTPWPPAPHGRAALAPRCPRSSMVAPARSPGPGPRRGGRSPFPGAPRGPCALPRRPPVTPPASPLSSLQRGGSWSFPAAAPPRGALRSREPPAGLGRGWGECGGAAAPPAEPWGGMCASEPTKPQRKRL